MTSQRLASYWVNRGQEIKRNAETSYISLYDDGRSANVVVFMGNQKLQFPKWLMRDYLSLSQIIYPDQHLRRQNLNLKRLEVTDVMKSHLTAAGMQYDPGVSRTQLENVDIDPEKAFDRLTRAEIARSNDDVTTLLRKIVSDIREIGADVTTRSGVGAVQGEYGWTHFEIIVAWHILQAQEKKG